MKFSMNDEIRTDVSIFALFLLVASTNFNIISIESRVKDLDNKVTMIQERQQQLIQLINNQ